MTTHSLLPPSSAARRVACPGSRALEAQYPSNEESLYSKEGEAAHWVASEFLLKGDYTPGVGIRAPNGELVTAEMIEGAELYAETIFNVAPWNLLRVEQKISIRTIHSDCWGTPDCWAYLPEKNKLFIFDYKFGFGFVEVFENWQLLEYAAGIIEEGVPSEDRSNLTIDFFIVQPRSFHKNGPVRNWSINFYEAVNYFTKLRETEALAMHPEALCKPNLECAFCLGRHACNALQRSALTITDLATVSTPHDLQPNELGSELRYLKRAEKLLEARITGLEEEALANIKNGKRIPFFSIEQGSGRERWIVPPEEVILLGEMLGQNLAKPPSVITPKQAIDLGIDPEVVREYSETPRGTLKLVMDDPNAARKLFGDK